MPRGSRRGQQRSRALQELRSGDPVVGLPAGERVEDGWVVRSLSGAATDKTYRCPGCDHEVASRTPHVVAWPDGQPDLRRHWHSPCWAARERRRPR